MNYYEQTKAFKWLNTPAGTIWVDFKKLDNGQYIQPEEEHLRDTLLGVNLDLLDDEDLVHFKRVVRIQLPVEK